MSDSLTPQAIRETLAMQRHPEGGWYAEIFRDTAGGPRGHCTAIYYLLEEGERSHWHRVLDAAEIWHHYAGDPAGTLPVGRWNRRDAPCARHRA